MPTPPRKALSSLQQIAKNMRSGERSRLVPALEEGQLADLPYNTQTYVFFTAVNQNELLFTAPGWVTVKLTLNNAGPVAISTSQDVLPVLSGRGILLVTGIEKAIALPKGNRLFIGAAAVNSVSVVIEPIPWLQTLALSIDRNTRSIVRGIGQAVRIFRPETEEKTNEVPCPPKHRPFFPKGRKK